MTHSGRAPLTPLRKATIRPTPATSMALTPFGGCLSIAYMSAAQLPSGSSNSPTIASPGPCHGPRYATTEGWRLLVHNHLNDSSRSAAVLPQYLSAHAIHPLIPAMYSSSYNRAPESCKALHHSSQHISTFPATATPFNISHNTLHRSLQYIIPLLTTHYTIFNNAPSPFPVTPLSPFLATHFATSYNALHPSPVQNFLVPLIMTVMIDYN